RRVVGRRAGVRAARHARTGRERERHARRRARAGRGRVWTRLPGAGSLSLAGHDARAGHDRTARGGAAPGRGGTMIDVVLADDQALVRGGFRALIDSEADMRVVAEAATGDDAVRLALEHLPDVVLMDIRMPGLDGLEATRRIVPDRAASPRPLLALTTFEPHAYGPHPIRR